jgi:hypothetical protein
VIDRPGRADELVAGLGGQDRDLIRARRDPGGEVGRDPGAVEPPHRGLLAGDAAQIRVLADPPQHDAARQNRLGGHLARVAEQHRRRRLRHEAGRDQALGQLHRQVVGPYLPLDGLAAGPEVVPLADDEPIQRRTGDTEVAHRPDTSDVPADDPQHRPVVLMGDTRRNRTGRHPHVLVVLGQQGGGVHHAHMVPEPGARISPRPVQCDRRGSGRKVLWSSRRAAACRSRRAVCRRIGPGGGSTTTGACGRAEWLMWVLASGSTDRIMSIMVVPLR